MSSNKTLYISSSEQTQLTSAAAKKFSQGPQSITMKIMNYTAALCVAVLFPELSAIERDREDISVSSSLSYMYIKKIVRDPQSITVKIKKNCTAAL